MATTFLKYGNYEHALADAAVSIQRFGVPDDTGTIYANREVWTVQGRLEADTQAELTTAIESLENAYAVQAGEIALRFEGGTETAHKMNVSNMLTPIQVSQAPSYPIGTGAEYSTFRNYTIQVEGLVRTGAARNDLLFYKEDIQTSGGLPRDALVTTLNTPPIRQRVADFTPFFVRQSGRAISLRGWVIPPAPKLNIINEAVLLDNTANKLGPTETFSGGTRIDSRFESNWSYTLATTFRVDVPGTRRPVTAPTTLV